MKTKGRKFEKPRRKGKGKKKRKKRKQLPFLHQLGPTDLYILHSTPLALDFASPLRLRQFIFSRYFDSLFPAVLTTSNAQLSWLVGLFLNASQVLGLENRKDELLYYLVVQTLPCIIIIAHSTLLILSSDSYRENDIRPRY